MMNHRIVQLMAAVLVAGTALCVDPPTAQAQEIQLTGPLAGAPAVRRLRLRREERFEIAPHASFTLLDEYRRTIMPGIRASYHFFDWLGASLFFGYGVQYNAALADEIQDKAVNDRNCTANPNALACKRTAVSLCRGNDCLAEKQLGRFQWMIAPQINVVPFRGKVSLFGELFVDTDINIFLGPAIIGLQQREDCTKGNCAGGFALAGSVTAAPTFGLGLNFHPLDYLSFGTEFRGIPFAWNTSGFDNAGAGEDEAFPDDQIDGADSQLRFNPMMTVYVAVQLPTAVKISD